ncbi:FCN1-like protein [Mya arenaria]|uniref:FCN1-like protein n=1 Tax=Mya arenaria TaxID=6604 RepID=A0ABY7EE34_MYAAR|nr:FCN1-like protein [Mya arenaria]
MKMFGDLITCSSCRHIPKRWSHLFLVLKLYYTGFLLGHTALPGWTDMPCSMRCCNTTLCNQISCGQVTTPVADPCSSNPCQRGSCTSLNGDFECHCPSEYSGQTCDMGPLPTDCKDILNRPYLFSNRGDGVYTIMLPRSRTVLQVFCDMTYDSGGWTVFQRRVTRSPYFNRSMTEYNVQRMCFRRKRDSNNITAARRD